jgi:hypothetical protein
MARWTISGANSAAPLIIQLEASDGVVAEVVEANAIGENAIGSASYPRIFRPGTGAGMADRVITPMDQRSGSSRVRAGHEISSTLRLPDMQLGEFSLPISVNWRFPVGFRPSFTGTRRNPGFMVLYAKAEGGHAWDGQMTWEEL